jgi:hypothetical protein
MPGRRTLSTTAVPSASRARCTWARLAAASGTGSSSANTASGASPRVFDQLPAQVFEGQRRRGVLQLAELGDPLGRKEIAPGRQDLPQLDEGRPQLLERPAHPGGRLEPGQVFGLAPVQGLAGPLQRARHPDPPHQAAEAVAHQHRGNLLHTPQIAGGTEGFP